MEPPSRQQNVADQNRQDRKPVAGVEALSEFVHDSDLHDLCDATILAIQAGGGFGWIKPPSLELLERYWRGVLLVPDRHLFVARLDGVIAGSVQLVLPTRQMESQAHSAWLTTQFVAPWARGYGLARQLVLAVEDAARAHGASVLNLDVRATQIEAMTLYQSLGFSCWGVHPAYVRIDGVDIAGHFYSKNLSSLEAPSIAPTSDIVETA